MDSATATSSGRAEFNRAQALDAPVARTWLEEQSGDHSDDLEHALWSLWDHELLPDDMSIGGMG